MEEEMAAEGPYGPLIAALPAFESFMKGILMDQRADLTKTQMDAMLTLHFTGKTGMGQLAERLAVSNEQASRAIGPLEQKGFVARSRNAQRYRVVEVELTDAGIAFLDSTRAEIDREIEERLEPLSQGERESLIAAAKTAVGILRKVNGDTPQPR